MRWIPVLTFVLLAAIPARGQEIRDREELARVAIEAKLQLGDLLRQKGDLEGALEAYGEAIAIHQRFLRGELRERKPEPRPVLRGEPKQAVELGLGWLARHQSEDGRWDCDDFEALEPGHDRSGGAGAALYDVGVTGLSTLAFLGAGFTDRGSEQENPYARQVRDGLRFLMTEQDDEGCLGSRASQHFMYNHALAASALCEAFARTQNPRYRAPAQKALDFIALARNPYMAWRYEPRGGENDTSVTAWCVAALDAGRRAGLRVDEDAFVGARAWIDKMTEPDFGRVGYNTRGGSPARPEGLQDVFPPEKTESMTAAGILTRILAGEDPRRSELILKGAALCASKPPRWAEGTVDLYYWYYGTRALGRVGGPTWKAWRAALVETALARQHAEGSGSKSGSWDPAGVWGRDGGRVYATALMTLCLEECALERKPQ